jgi:hypothetical protein
MFISNMLALITLKTLNRTLLGINHYNFRWLSTDVDQTTNNQNYLSQGRGLPLLEKTGPQGSVFSNNLWPPAATYLPLPPVREKGVIMRVPCLLRTHNPKVTKVSSKSRAQLALERKIKKAKLLNESDQSNPLTKGEGR